MFVTRRDAEEAAYHSAHAWAVQRRPQDPTVKTLLLPSSPQQQAQGQATASYGFISEGSLFWVRSCFVSTTSASHVEGAERGDYGYAVITEGVIGGTGNRMSRRGTEVCHGRIFVGDMATARHAALQVCQTCVQTIPGCTSYVATLPIGKPAEYVTGRFLQEWPPEVNLSPSSSNFTIMEGGSIMASSIKRNRNNFVMQQAHLLEESGLFLPMAKRQRIVHHERAFWQNDPVHQAPMEDEMVLS